MTYDEERRLAARLLKGIEVELANVRAGGPSKAEERVLPRIDRIIETTRLALNQPGEWRNDARNAIHVHVQDLSEVAKTKLRKKPRYQTAAFKCIHDYDRCQADRGRYSLVCGLALTLCMLKQVPPKVMSEVLSD